MTKNRRNWCLQGWQARWRNQICRHVKDSSFRIRALSTSRPFWTRCGSRTTRLACPTISRRESALAMAATSAGWNCLSAKTFRHGFRDTTRRMIRAARKKGLLEGWRVVSRSSRERRRWKRRRELKSNSITTSDHNPYSRWQLTWEATKFTKKGCLSKLIGFIPIWSLILSIKISNSK